MGIAIGAAISAWRRIVRLSTAVGLAIVLSVSAENAFASPIVPGQTVSPDVFTLGSRPPLLDETNGTFSLTAGADTITGTYAEAVLVDPFGVTCAGCVDFALQVGVDPGQPGAIQDVFYGGFLLKGVPSAVDVGYVTGTGDVAPSSIGYGPAGEDMRFTLAANLFGGMSTDILVIGTTATNYRTVNITPDDVLTGSSPFQLTGSDGTTIAFGQPMPGTFLEPAPIATPEPSSAILLATGLIGVVRRYRHRHSSR